MTAPVLFDLDRLQWLIAAYYQVNHSVFTIEEPRADDNARAGGTITFSINSPVLRIRLPERPIAWLKNQKCADGIAIEVTQHGSVLHIIELKSKLTVKEWEKVKLQAEGALLNGMAISGLINIPKFSKVILHVALHEDAVQTNANPSPVLLKVGLGVRQIRSAVDWLNRRCEILTYDDVQIRTIQRDDLGNGEASL